MQQPTTQTVYDLFNGRIQFQVPVYQRAYVWNEDDNWAVMWDDIADTADRYLADPEAHVHNRHFLGPIVLDQEHSDPGGVDPRLVIDGQQRLTTLQIILAAAAAAAREHGADDISSELSELTANRGTAAAGDRRFKIWPSRRDRKAFLATIDADHLDGPDTGIPGAWTFFHSNIKTWIADDGEAPADEQVARLRALKICLESLLYVVSINLDESDNAQVIFETLNARGTGLGALDLVKNAIFLQAEREGTSERLHDEWWEPTFEADEYWLEETRQGREKRARADWFLMHWLAMELGRVVRADKLFDTFRKDILHTATSRSMAELVPRLCNDAKIMRSFDDLDPASPAALFFSRLETMDTTTLLPVALFLFRTQDLSEDRRLRALAALESWLVRRAILRLTSRNYNRTLPSLLKAIKNDTASADEAIVRELRSSQANTVIWPSDDQIRPRLERGEVYGYIGQPRVRMLLEACELDIRDTTKTELVALPEGLSIEHALPRSWEENWPTPDSEDPDTVREEREAHVNRLGNLTLVTQPLNGALSNYPWTATPANPHSKREELASRSVLLINHRLCQHDQWDEANIDARSAELAERIVRTWPGPESDSWPAMAAKGES
jgi:Protein of unknown function DUF262/Protein of unknown function (DUF1524)